MSDGARSDNVRHTAAKGDYRFFFRLLTGGLLVRIQPEEPLFSMRSASRSDRAWAVLRPASSQNVCRSVCAPTPCRPERGRLGQAAPGLCPESVVRRAVFTEGRNAAQNRAGDDPLETDGHSLLLGARQSALARLAALNPDFALLWCAESGRPGIVVNSHAAPLHSCKYRWLHARDLNPR